MTDDFDDEENFPLQFHEELGEHALSDDVRKAIMWAAIEKFLVDTSENELIDHNAFTDKDRALAKAVMFHGPFTNHAVAAEQAKRQKGVVVSPELLWTDTSQPVWIASLTN